MPKYQFLKYKLYPFLTGLVLASSPLAQTANKQWVAVATLASSDIYVRENTIEKVGDYLKIWVLYNYHNVRTSPNDESFNSATTLFQFDCQEKRSQMLNSYGFGEMMGKGKQIDLLEKNPPWIDLPANSIGWYLIEEYCSN